MEGRRTLGAIVNNLGPSQMSFYMIKEFNKLATDLEMSASCYYNNLAAPVHDSLFACMNIYSLANFHGFAISTDLESTQILLNSNNNSKKYFYVWDLEWIRRTISFNVASSLFRDERISILARSNSHKDAIENMCNKSVRGIVNDWNLDQIKSIISFDEGLS